MENRIIAYALLAANVPNAIAFGINHGAILHHPNGDPRYVVEAHFPINNRIDCGDEFRGRAGWIYALGENPAYNKYA